jgi:hypothetical protein
MSNYSRYKSRHTHSIDTDLLIAIIGLVLCVLFLFGSNACTAKEWNDGICPDCNTRYELRGVYKGTHYYACPGCGNEVDRYGGR